MEVRPDDRDTPRKEALDEYLEPALRLLFPAVHVQVDWARGWQALDGELQKVVRDAEIGRRFADKLFRVKRRGGAEVWVALHLEVQGEVDHRLAERVRVYRNRIHDRYEVPVASLVVLADDDRAWRPGTLEEEVLGCREQLEFPTVKLLDFEPRTDELLEDPNPFALVVLAHLASLRTRRLPDARLQWRRRLVRALYDRGHGRQVVLDLLRFLDWLLALPPPLEGSFNRWHEQLEEEKNMPYKMKFELEAEARGELRGEAKGREEGQRALIRTVLEARFGALPPELLTRIEGIRGSARLEALARKAAVAGALDDVLGDLDASDPSR